MASSYVLFTTSACRCDLGRMEHENGSGLELNPSVNAKLVETINGCTLTVYYTFPDYNSHVNTNILPRLVFCGGHIESPQYPGYVEVDRRSPEMHAGTDPATPAKCGMTEGTGEATIFEKALRLELVRFREVLLVEMDYRGGLASLCLFSGRGRKQNQMRTYWSIVER